MASTRLGKHHSTAQWQDLLGRFSARLKGICEASFYRCCHLLRDSRQTLSITAGNDAPSLIDLGYLKGISGGAGEPPPYATREPPKPTECWTAAYSSGLGWWHRPEAGTWLMFFPNNIYAFISVASQQTCANRMLTYKPWCAMYSCRSQVAVSHLVSFVTFMYYLQCSSIACDTTARADMPLDYLPVFISGPYPI